MIRLKHLVSLLAALAFLLLPLGASAHRSDDPNNCVGGSMQANRPMPQPGETVKFTMRLMTFQVDTLQMSIIKLQSMKLLSTSLFPTVDAVPTWMHHNLNGISYLRFSAKVSKAAPRGHRLFVQLHSLGQSSVCQDNDNWYLTLHVPKHS